MKIAFIPARGGSKRFPGKNTALLNDVPLLVYSIRFARYSGIFDRIIISTDDQAIARVAVHHGAEVLHRPDAISGDVSPTKEAVLHCAEALRLADSDWIFTLQPTNPFRPKDLMHHMQDLLDKFPKAQSVLSVSELHKKMGHVEHGRYIPTNYTFGERSQDVRMTYFENGLIYGTEVSLIRGTGEMLEKSPVALLTEATYSMVDIDRQEDLEMAELVWHRKKQVFEYLTDETKY